MMAQMIFHLGCIREICLGRSRDGLHGTSLDLIPIRTSRHVLLVRPRAEQLEELGLEQRWVGVQRSG